MRLEEMTLSQRAEWYYSFSESYAEILGEEYLEDCWEKSRRYLGNRGQFLRASLLRKARIACSSCTDCDLHQNRLPSRPVWADASYHFDPFATFGEPPHLADPVAAEIMVVAEGPGVFEQRTGIPFVSPLILTGSPCARLCGGYESCYPAGKPAPQAPCKPSSLLNQLGNVEEEIRQVREERAKQHWRIQTAGSLLDQVILTCGLWREGWNGRQSALTAVKEGQEPKPGTVYLCNTVKCRSCKENPNHAGGIEDAPPTTEQLAACSKWLTLQIEIVQPKVILALGNPAVKALLALKDPKILSLCGEIHRGPNGIPTVPCIHPSYALRQGEDSVKGEQMQKILAAFKTAQRIAAGTEALPWESGGTRLMPVEIPAAPRPSEMRPVPTQGEVS